MASLTASTCCSSGLLPLTTVVVKPAGLKAMMALHDPQVQPASPAQMDFGSYAQASAGSG